MRNLPIISNGVKKIFLIIFLGSLLFPLISLAGSYQADGIDVYYDGLIPCGRDVCLGDSLDIEEIENALREGTDLPVACTSGGGQMYSTLYPSHTPELPSEMRCTFCHFFVMLDGIIDFVLFKLVPPIAILMLVIGGVMFMFAHFGGAEMIPGGGAGGPKMLNQAKGLITSVVIGLIIIFAAWIIIDLFLSLIGLSEFSIQAGLGPGEWNKIQCTIELPK